MEKYRLKKQPEGAKGIKGFGVGALKGVGSTAVGAGQLLEKILPGDFLAKPETFEKAREKLKPKGTAEKIGFGAEQIGEFFLPMGLASKAVKASEAMIKGAKLAKPVAELAKIGARVGISAAETGAVTAIQTGGDKSEVVRNALIGGAIPIVGAVVKGVAKGVGMPLAKRIETTVIKPTKTDIQDGFKIDTIFKYNLGGSLKSTADKTHETITKLGKELKNIEKTNPQKVNLISYLNQARKELTFKKPETFGSNTRINKALEFLEEEIKSITDNGIVKFGDAVQVKRGVGKLGAWQYGVKDPDITALEKAANMFYSKLKVGLENTAKGTKYAEINKNLSELIPVENAILRRIPIADRNQILSLGDMITALPAFANPANLWIWVLNKALKSGEFANFLARTAKEPLKRGVARTLIFGSPIGPK